MNEREYVVVGINDSPEAMVSARFALHEAVVRGLNLRVVHAYQMPPMTPPVTAEAIVNFAQAAESLLNLVVSQLDVPASVWVERLPQQTSPGVLLARQAEVAALIVIGQHHITWGDQQRVGRLASHLGAKAPCPVVTVPRGWSQSGVAKRPVVVALDGETAALAALRFAFEEAELRGVSLVALHAMPLDSLPGDITEHEANIAEVLAGWKQDHPDTLTRMITMPGEPDETIVEASQGAALLVVGRPHNRSLGAWARSVARAVVRQTPCPLVVVPQDPPDSVATSLVRNAELSIAAP